MRETTRLDAKLASLRETLNTPLDMLERQYLETVMSHNQTQTANESTSVLNETQGEVERCADLLTALDYPETKNLLL
jgi:hypothetical protein